MALDEGGDTLRFTVWDTGIGIAAEDQRRVFQPFVQLDGGLARHQGGTGLGLALVRKLVELHGGGAAVESEVGRGSRFSVLLPTRLPGTLTVPPTRTVPPVSTPHLAPRCERLLGLPSCPPRSMSMPPRSLRILVAEDDEAHVTTVLGLLRSRGFETFVVARSGREAVSALRSERPDLILMGAQLPGLSGLATIHEIRADEAAVVRATPIIALSALAVRGDREQYLAAGANGYLTRPLTARRLAEAIDSALASR